MTQALFSCVINNGGMRRIAQWTMRYSEEFDDVFFVIFSPDKIKTNKNLMHVQMDEFNNTFTEEVIAKYQATLKTQLGHRKFSFKIADYMTLAYIDFIKIPTVYDTHILGKPLHDSILKTSKLQKFDGVFFKNAITSMIDLMSFSFLRFENSWIKVSGAYVTNSKITSEHLKKYYKDQIENKTIFHIPLPGAAEKKDLSEYSQRKFKYDIYTFARVHPQKGFHFILNNDWSKTGLTIRGLDINLLTSEGEAFLAQKNITNLNWTNSQSQLERDILSSRFILFPSIYEPFGLALQEALSLGAICICHKNNSGHEEQITHGINGFLVDMESEDWILIFEELKQMETSKLDEISLNAIKSANFGDTNRNQSFRAFIQQQNSALSCN